MPYSFRKKRYSNAYNRKRKFRSRKGYGFPKKSTVSNAMYWAKAAWKGVKFIRGLVNSEMYHFDTQLVGAEILSDGLYAGHLTAIPNGDGDGARTGNSVYVKGCHIRGTIVHDPQGLDNQRIRVMVVVDTQQIADTVPTPSVWLSGAGGVYVQAHLNQVNLGRFTVLYDKQFVVGSATSGIASLVNFEINLPMAMHVHFNSTAGTDIQKNGIYIGAVSDEATTTEGPALSYNARLSYHDN